MYFPYFSKLPLELRIEIWRYALLAESQDRVVLLHDTHVIPRPSLINPLLAVDRTSRKEALRFYPVALKVVDLPKFVAPLYFKPTTSVLCSMARQARMLMAFERRLDDLVPVSRSEGTIYLNPTHDTFIVGLDFAPLYAKRSLTHFGSGSRSDRRVPTRPIAESLDLETTCREIRKVVLAEWDGHGDYHPSMEANTITEYAGALAERLWDRATFSGCTTFQHLWLGDHTEEWGMPPRLRPTSERLDGGVECARQLMRGDGRGERSRLDIRSWTPVKKRDGSAVVVSRVYSPGEARAPRTVHYRRR
ncbi:hypothetical protein PG996_007926 [Apiospora saccharicola]|uniref:2EXR domain-containing protein n=1 Tax=Apiospora saccharicola TaxID=335842 RepID=A0ABR1UZM1_9PEZI